MTAPLSTEYRAEIQERLDGVGDANWSAEDQRGDWVVLDPGRAYLGGCPDCGVRAGFEREEAEFIAHSPQDIADLLAEVERLQARVDLYEERGCHPKPRPVVTETSLLSRLTGERAAQIAESCPFVPPPGGGYVCYQCGREWLQHRASKNGDAS